jgi:hypothetical protein
MISYADPTILEGFYLNWLTVSIYSVIIEKGYTIYFSIELLLHLLEYPLTNSNKSSLFEKSKLGRTTSSF